MKKGQSVFYLYLPLACIDTQEPLLPAWGGVVDSGGKRHQSEDTKFKRRSCYPQQGASMWAGTCTICSSSHLGHLRIYMGPPIRHQITLPSPHRLAMSRRHNLLSCVFQLLFLLFPLLKFYLFLGIETPIPITSLLPSS